MVREFGGNVNLSGPQSNAPLRYDGVRETEPRRYE
jgi:hypothetical protein